jgi:hypothetical protein
LNISSIYDIIVSIKKMERTEMIFYVLGNGFDLHYKLPTQYCNFKQYLIRNGYGELVGKVDIAAAE